jgi:K+-sensing histidine kinase KdpD
MGARLKKSEQNQIEMVQAISHDLKTPLTSILGYVKRLLDGKASEENKKQEYYKIIYRKAGELENLVEELEEYAGLNGNSW